MKKLTIEEMHKIAVQRNGKCLSKEYVDSRTKLLWQCDLGHQWWATPGHIKSGKWCRECSYERNATRTRLTIDYIRNEAVKRGWKCLSSFYKNASTPLKWECGNGHIFLMAWNKVQQGQGCHICNNFNGEEFCRAFFEVIFERPFPSCRPAWLLSIKGRRMQLDGYCEELGIAIEHQGEQHYRPIGHYTEQMVAIIQERDKQKRRICESRGITLLEIPDVLNMTGLSNLASTIKTICEERGLKLPKDPVTLDLNLRNAHTDRSRKELEKLKAAALKKGGILLSDLYINASTYYSFKCGAGHQFRSTAMNVLHNKKGWCPYCGQRHRASQLAMNDRIKGLGVCLTEDIKNVRQVVRFRCDANGHEFEDVYDNVSIRIKQHLSFCPLCKKWKI